MIPQRVRQVLAALRAHLSAEDWRFIDAWLQPDEKALFASLTLADQYHALQTAYTARQLLPKYPAANQHLLLRCALLHDVGRVRGDMGTKGKILAVLLHAAAPDWVRNKGAADGPAGSLQHMLYVYLHHAELGAAKLSALGLSAEASIVAGHHKAPAEYDPPELKILRMADGMN